MFKDVTVDIEFKYNDISVKQPLKALVPIEVHLGKLTVVNDVQLTKAAVETHSHNGKDIDIKLEHPVKAARITEVHLDNVTVVKLEQ